MSLSLSQMTLRELVEIERAGQAIVDAALTEFLIRVADGRVSTDALSPEEQVQLRGILAAARKPPLH